MKKTIVITEFMDQVSVDALKENFNVIYEPQLFKDREKLRELVEQADALIVRNQTQVNHELLAAAKQLIVVGRLGVGLDNIAVAECQQSNIKVIPATGANANAVAEYVITMALVLMRQAYCSTQSIAAGEWPRQQLSQGFELNGKVLGLVGFGQISQQVARKAKAFDMLISAYDPFLPLDSPVWREYGVQALSLDELLQQADVLSLHIPLTEATKNLVGMDAFKKMKKTAVVINSARGGIIHEAELCLALKTGELAGAALDVFSTEPPPDASQYTDIKNLILTPHIAGVSVQSNQNVSAMIAREVEHYLLTKEQ